MKLPRCAGILLHPTSLPSPFGVGDFGPAAFDFVDQLAAAGQTIWQVLPLGPTGYGDSPYQAYSAFAGETLLLSPEVLVREGLLTPSDLSAAPSFLQNVAAFTEVREWKQPLLVKAFQAFQAHATAEQQRCFQQFTADHSSWLDDYALFVALRSHFGTDRSWTAWDKPLALRNPAALARAREEHAPEILRQKFWQFLFYQQWGALRRHCTRLGIHVLGDIPIYVAHDSADVWAQPKQFLLDEHGNPEAISGVPPDYFSETGQLWGNPIYNWTEMERSGFRWWIERFRGTFRLYDAVRVDHFRGFEAFWQVPATEKTAVNGQWVKAPGRKLFQAVTAELGALEIVAENLGVITPEVEQLREEFDYPGMAILQFAFSIEGNAAIYRPHNMIREVVAYTGTHDNDTVCGWWDSEGGDSTRSKQEIEQEKAFVTRYLGASDEHINWKMLRCLFGSVALWVVVPIQDVLGLGTETRMNRPGVGSGNWAWRMQPGALHASTVQKLRDLTELFDRTPPKAEPAASISQ